MFGLVILCFTLHGVGIDLVFLLLLPFAILIFCLGLVGFEFFLFDLILGLFNQI